MKQIANMTVIRGNGGCEAYLNGVVQKEIRRQQELMRKQHAAETERARTIEGNRDSMRSVRLAELEHMLNRSPNLLQCLWEPVANAWYMFWALIYIAGELFLNWCIKHDLVQRVEGGEAHV